MYDIVPWFGEVIAAVLAIMIIAFVLRLRAYMSQVQATNVALVPSPTDSGRLSGLNLKNLSSELATVIEWLSLGLNLGLQQHELAKIERDYQGNDRRRLQMLNLWLQRTPNATWEDVVDALQQMGENTVAENIREKYIRGRSKLHKEAENDDNDDKKMVSLSVCTPLLGSQAFPGSSFSFYFYFFIACSE